MTTNPRKRRQLVALVPLFALSMIPAAGADDAKKKTHFDRGAEAWTKKSYPDAAFHFKKAFAEDDSMEALFAWAQAERKAGDCKEAVFLYKRLLRRAPNSKQAKLVVRAQEECEPKLTDKDMKDIRNRLAALDKPKAGAPPVSNGSQQPTVITKTLVVEKKTISRSRAPAYALMAAGVAGLGLGAGFYFSADSLNADVAATYQERLDNADTVESRVLISRVGFGVGGGLLTAGILWMALGGGEITVEQPRVVEEPTVGFWGSDRDVGLSLSGSF